MRVGEAAVELDAGAVVMMAEAEERLCPMPVLCPLPLPDDSGEEGMGTEKDVVITGGTEGEEGLVTPPPLLLPTTGGDGDLDAAGVRWLVEGG